MEITSFTTHEEWRVWLSIYYQNQEGIWLRMYKKASGIPSVDYKEALDVALCYGWIDGQKKSYDETSWLQRFSPRRPRSIWSKVNREHVARLIAEGKMQTSGLLEIEAAKADGRWEAAYDSQSTAIVPEDFQKALEEHPEAKVFFESLKKAQKYSFLFRIHTAKKVETRERRIHQFIEMLEKGETFH